MKTWALLYLLIWAVFLEMLIVYFPPFSYLASLDLHLAVGVLVVGLAFLVFRQVRLSPCPDRIKRITKMTLGLAVFDGALGIVLFLVARSVFTIPFNEFVEFVHFATAIAIITQASSSATAFDMWEEKEFAQTAA